MDKFFSHFKQSRLLNIVFLSNIFLSFHYYIIVYVNSSFLSGFFTESQVSALYIIGSIVDMLVLLNVSKLLGRIGNYRLTLYAIITELLSTLGLIITTSPALIGFYFLLHLVMSSLLLFNLDIFVESVSTDETQTGGIRATFLTTANITLVISPTIVALLLVHNAYWKVYTTSFLLLIPLYFYIKKFKDFKTGVIPHIRVKETIMAYMRDKNLYNIFVAQFLLQLFYAFMIVYTPIYLQKFIGFSWTEIGIMFTIMLLPFILFELPVGEMSDKKYGEKEFLSIGFIVMGLSTLFISFVTIKSFWIWTSILFISRIGASFVEVSSDTYFFKKVNQTQTDIISMYRITRPLSFVVAPLLATLALQFIPFQYTFILIGMIMIIGTRYSIGLVDTK